MNNNDGNKTKDQQEDQDQSDSDSYLDEVDTVMDHAWCSREVAIKALNDHDNIIDAILSAGF